MQAAVYHGKENIQVQEWPAPELSSEEILVKVQYAGICGSDMMICGWETSSHSVTACFGT